MQRVWLDVPHDVVEGLVENGHHVSRSALEVLALDAYRMHGILRQQRQHELAYTVVRDQMRWQDHIVATSDTLHGWPRFRNTRIPVAVVLDNLAAGVSAHELHADYPTLPNEAIPAALAYAADLARDTIVPIPAA